MKILIIDTEMPDDAGSNNLAALLADDSFGIVRVHRVAEALDVLARDPFDLVMLDMDLPENRNNAALRLIRMRAPDLPVILISSEKTEAAARQALGEGAVDYLVREELNSRYLFRTLRYAIERHQFDRRAGRTRDQLGMLVADGSTRLDEVNTRLKKENETRRQREQELKRSNRLLRVLTECNQALAHAKNEQELLTWICEVMVFTGGYPYAWIGFLDPEKDPPVLQPVADAGFTNGKLGEALIVREDTEQGSGPGASSMRTKKPSVIRNIRKNARYREMAAEAKSMGYGSAVGLPILMDEGQMPGGSLILLSRSPASFDSEEKKILTRLAEDISFGIRAMRTREAHAIAEEALHESEMFYRTVINTLPVGIAVVDTDDKLAFLSPKTCEMLHLPASEDGLGTSFSRYLRAQPAEATVKNFRQLQKKSGAGAPAECSVTRADGSSFWAELRSASLRNSVEEVIGTLVVTQDITERKVAAEKIRKAYTELEERVEERTADLYTANLELQKEITRREQLMAALRDSEQSLRDNQRLLDAAEKLAHIGSWEWDIPTGTLRWSDEHFRIYGYEPHAVSPTRDLYLSAILPGDRRKVTGLEKAVLDGEGEYDVVFRIARPDGVIRFIHNRGEVKRDSGGKPAAIRGSAQDITERRRAEEELARLATIVAQSDDAIIGMNPDTTVFSWNAGAEKIFGYSAGEAIGQGIGAIVSPRRNTKINHNLGMILAGEPLRTFESLCRRKDGSHFYASLTISPVRDEHGATSGIIFIARNITDRKRIQHELRESEQKYRSLFETMAQAVLVIDPRGDIADANPAAERLLGIPRAQLKGKTALIPGLDPVQRDGTKLRPESAPWIRAFREGAEIRDIVGIRHPGGSGVRWMIADATPNYRAGEHAPHQVSLVLNDITGLDITGDRLQERAG
ncbi:MAG TPA: PAS domain S-box protein [Methanoregula sp.]|nr:PAS domain S-box protein [Methanoregula sp.]